MRAERHNRLARQRIGLQELLNGKRVRPVPDWSAKEHHIVSRQRRYGLDGPLLAASALLLRRRQRERVRFGVRLHRLDLDQVSAQMFLYPFGDECRVPHLRLRIVHDRHLARSLGRRRLRRRRIAPGAQAQRHRRAHGQQHQHHDSNSNLKHIAPPSSLRHHFTRYGPRSLGSWSFAKRPTHFPGSNFVSLMHQHVIMP